MFLLHINRVELQSTVHGHFQISPSPNKNIITILIHFFKFILVNIIPHQPSCHVILNLSNTEITGSIPNGYRFSSILFFAIFEVRKLNQ